MDVKRFVDWHGCIAICVFYCVDEWRQADAYRVYPCVFDCVDV